jgi:hypothetical protein
VSVSISVDRKHPLAGVVPDLAMRPLPPDLFATAYPSRFAAPFHAVDVGSEVRWAPR